MPNHTPKIVWFSVLHSSDPAGVGPIIKTVKSTDLYISTSTEWIATTFSTDIQQMYPINFGDPLTSSREQHLAQNTTRSRSFKLTSMPSEFLLH